MGDERAIRHAGEAQGREARVAERQAHRQEDVREIHQEVAGHGPYRVLHPDEPALEGEQRQRRRRRPDADVKVSGGKGLHLRGTVHQQERHLHDHPLQGHEHQSGPEGNPQGAFQRQGDVFPGQGGAGRVLVLPGKLHPSIGLGREAPRAAPQEAEVPVQHVEEHRPDGDAADEGGGRDPSGGAEVAGDGDVHHAHQGDRDVRKDAGNGEAEDVPVEIHRNFWSSSSIPR